jgi:CMP-N-acetylneuraminic acid synthetase
MSRHKTIALLPMKANSERVKGKNFKHFSGKPLFQWTLNTLLSVKEIDQVIINTDARELLINNGLVENDRLLIRDRRPEICGDLVSMNLIIEDDINNSDADVYLMTHTTNPMMKANTVRDALAVFNSNQAIDSLFTVDKIQTRFYDKDCNPVNHNPDNLLRTQDLEPWYEENSNLYIFTKKSFINTKARIGKNPMMYETPKFESIDIDTPSDWDLAVLINDYLLEREKQK